MSLNREQVLAGLRQYADVVADFNKLAAATGQRPILGVDLSPDDQVTPPTPSVDGWSNMRADGAVQLDGYERFRAECLAGGDQFLIDWATKQPRWAFVRECMDAPGITERQRQNIGGNCGRTQSRSWYLHGANETPIQKRSATWPAFEFAAPTDGQLFAEGAPILDAHSFGQESGGGFARPVAAEAYRYAEYHAKKARASRLVGPGFGFTPKG